MIVNDYPEVPAGEVRVGDLLLPRIDYRGDDDSLTAVCESATRFKGPYMNIVWRIVATGETYTSNPHEEDIVLLMRRGPDPA